MFDFDLYYCFEIEEWSCSNSLANGHSEQAHKRAGSIFYPFICSRSSTRAATAGFAPYPYFIYLLISQRSKAPDCRRAKTRGARANWPWKIGLASP